MVDQKLVPVIGLIGGVGSGKSSVARNIATRLKISVVDGDKVGHEVLKSPFIKDEILQRFGNSVFDEQGKVDRSALGREVFGSNPSNRAALADLEKIVHPEVRKSLQIRIEELKALHEYEAIILDAAVLLEAGWQDLCDAVVFIETPYDQRLERVSKTRGWNQDDLNLRESSQLSLDSKRQTADETIDNSGTLDDAGSELERILNHTKSNLP